MAVLTLVSAKWPPRTVLRRVGPPSCHDQTMSPSADPPTTFRQESTRVDSFQTFLGALRIREKLWPWLRLWWIMFPPPIAKMSTNTSASPTLCCLSSNVRTGLMRKSGLKTRYFKKFADSWETRRGKNLVSSRLTPKQQINGNTVVPIFALVTFICIPLCLHATRLLPPPPRIPRTHVCDPWHGFCCHWPNAEDSEQYVQRVRHLATKAGRRNARATKSLISVALLANRRQLESSLSAVLLFLVIRIFAVPSHSRAKTSSFDKNVNQPSHCRARTKKSKWGKTLQNDDCAKNPAMFRTPLLSAFSLIVPRVHTSKLPAV